MMMLVLSRLVLTFGGGGGDLASQLGNQMNLGGGSGGYDFKRSKCLPRCIYIASKKSDIHFTFPHGDD
jgi:hypothetical protein